MAAPTRGSDTFVDRVHVLWSALVSPADGFSPVTTYALFWDAGTDGATFTSIIGVDSEYLGTSYLRTVGVTTGVTY